MENLEHTASLYLFAHAFLLHEAHDHEKIGERVANRHNSEASPFAGKHLGLA